MSEERHDLPEMPGAVLRRLRLLPAVELGTAMIHLLIRRLHTLQMLGSPDSMRPLGGSGGRYRADKVH